MKVKFNVRLTCPVAARIPRRAEPNCSLQPTGQCKGEGHRGFRVWGFGFRFGGLGIRGFGVLGLGFTSRAPGAPASKLLPPLKPNPLDPTPNLSTVNSARTD